MDLDLENSRVIVTGGTRALGAAIVSAFLEEGARVVTNYHSNVAAAEALRDQVPSRHSARLTICRLDVSSQVENVELIETTRRTLGGVDILINNAAIQEQRQKEVFTVNDFDFDQVMHTTLRGLIYATRAAMAHMIENRNGSIVNISSSGVYTANPREILYACSKAGVEAATRTFAAIGAPHGVRVNAIAPHVIAGGMGMEKSREESTLKNIPLGRTGTPEEVAALVLFLASRRNGFMTGTVVTLDGGRLLARK